ncbi:MAG: alpha/beta fold hydrolase [Acidimicrobiales bacterium]
MRRLRSTSGVEVAVHDLGGGGRRGADKPDLLIVHATGFCAQMYSRLAVSLGAEYRCWGLDLRGHGLSVAPAGLDYAWEGFGEDVLAAVAGLGLTAAVAVGHSSGGAAMLLAEARKPATFSALWCYEPIVWPPEVRDGARARAEALSEGARRRRARFSSSREAYLNFASKPPLSTFAPAAIRAYIDHGFAVDEADGSLVLRCRPEVEAEIYLKAAEGDRFGPLADVACPVTVACGARTDAIRPPLAERLAGAVQGPGRVRTFDRLAHFGPFEDPAVVAEAILADLRSAPVS